MLGSTSTSSSSSSSNQNTYNNLINTTNTTGIVDTSSTTSSSTSPNSSNAQAKQAILTPTTTSTTLNNSNECPSTNFTIEQLVQHQLANNNKYTLSRQQMFDLQHSHLLHHHHQQHDAPSQSPQTQHKFKNFTNQNLSQYVDLSQPQPNPPNLPPPPPMMHSSQATTAYLVQTPNGSALLIPPNNHFMQTASQTQSAQSTGTLSFNRNPYGITTIPLQNAAILNQNSGANLPHSPSITSGSCFVRPESTASTNVYQTIDTEKNGYLYPLESFYEGTASINNSNVPSTYNNPLLGNTNNCSMRHKRKCDQQKQLIQQHYQIQQQQQGSHLAKLIENHNNSGTMHSNTNNTNSNFFVSPALSASSNRRLNGSLLERIKYRLSKKMSAYCSWKCVAMLFLCISVIAFISFTVLLASNYIIFVVM